MSTIMIILVGIIGIFLYFNIGYWGWKSFCRADDKNLSEKLNFFEVFLIGPDGYWSDSFMRNEISFFSAANDIEDFYKKVSIFAWPIHLLVSIFSWFVWLVFFGGLFRVLFKLREN